MRWKPQPSLISPSFEPGMVRNLSLGRLAMIEFITSVLMAAPWLGLVGTVLAFLVLSGSGFLGKAGNTFFNWLMFAVEEVPKHMPASGQPRPVSFLDPHGNEDEPPPTWEELQEAVADVQKGLEAT